MRTLKEHLWRRRSLRFKLTAIIALPMVVLVSLVVMWAECQHTAQMKQSMVDSLDSLAQALNQDFEQLSFSGDQRVAADVADRLKSFPNIERVYAMDFGGAVFFAYISEHAQSRVPPEFQRLGSEFSGGYLRTWRGLTSWDQPFGHVYLESSASRLRDARNTSFGIAVAVCSTSVVVSILLAMGLQAIISRPILSLKRTAEEITRNKDSRIRAPKTTSDEVGQLANSFNHMLDWIQAVEEQLNWTNQELESLVARRTAQLDDTVRELQFEMDEHKDTQAERERLYSELISASRQAGMAEISASVLHNVGNILNSVNVSTCLLIERLKANRAEDLVRASALIGEHRDSVADFFARDPRGQKLPNFLSRLGESMVREKEEVLVELAGLEENVEHIKQVINMQQSFATTCSLQEPVDLAKLVDDAVKINDSSLLRHAIKVNREYDDVPQIVTDKHKVMQLLVNVIKNAKEAVSAAERQERWIRLTIGLHDAETLMVQVSDNGVGISPEHMARLFSHGFTTKKNGHGFGLHSGSLAAKELGGQLTVHSDGEGYGATFRLTLPREYGKTESRKTEPQEEHSILATP